MRHVRFPSSLAGYAWAPAANFMGVEDSRAGWDDAGAIILPIPYEATTSWRPGTRQGPSAILDASGYVEWYDEELDREPLDIGICTLPAVELSAAGPAAAIRELRALYDDLLDAAGDRLVIGLGGEHSISSAPATAWIERLDDEVSVLQFDAHADLRDEYHGTPWNHACVMRRILDRTERIVSVGLRALTTEEREVIRERDLTAIFAYEMAADGWIERVLDALGDNVYITFDVDFFDPAVMPATGTPEPGGGDWWDAMALLRAVFAECNVVGADVVELAPAPALHASAFTAAKLVYKMIGFWSERRAR